MSSHAPAAPSVVLCSLLLCPVAVPWQFSVSVWVYIETEIFPFLPARTVSTCAPRKLCETACMSRHALCASLVLAPLFLAPVPSSGTPCVGDRGQPVLARKNSVFAPESCARPRVSSYAPACPFIPCPCAQQCVVLYRACACSFYECMPCSFIETRETSVVYY